MCSKTLLPSPLRGQTGHSLVELTVVLCLLGIFSALAAPSVSQWLSRAQVENTVRTWAADLQTARLQALRTGQALRLQKLTGCATALPLGDWRCGWEVATLDDPTSPLLRHVMRGELSVLLFPANDFLPINAQGEPVAGGLRLQVMPRATKNPWAMSVCMNTVGRLRYVKSVTCT